MHVVLATVCSSTSWVTLTVFLVLGSYSWTPAGGQTCSLSAAQLAIHDVTVTAERVDGPTPAARVTWNTTIPPQCVAAVRVDFRTSNRGPVVANYTTTNTSGTMVIQTGLQCGADYYITVVVVTGGTSDGLLFTLNSNSMQVFVGDIPTPLGVRAEVTADNTSIRVSWQWSRQGVPMCVNLVRVHYQPEGGSRMMYTVGNTTTTSATLPNLQCNTKYTIWVNARGGQTGRTSVSRIVSLPANAPPTPSEVTAQFINASTVRVTWQWTSSGPAPNCFNTTTVTYHPEGGGGSSLQLSDRAATAATLTDLQCNTNYTITVVATAGEHRRESVARTVLSLQDVPTPVRVRAEATADNTSIRVSWQWSRQGLLTCVDLVTVRYRPEGGSLMMYTVSNTTATSATLPNLQCNAKYTIWVYARGGRTSKRSVSRMVYLPARASPTPTAVTAQFTSASTVRVTWQWISSDSAPNCFNTTTVTYRPEGGGESSLQLSDPAATAATLTDLQCNTNYTITVVATAGGHRRKRTVLLPVQGPRSLSPGVLSPTSVRLTWEAPCHTQQYHIYYRGTCGSYVDEGRLDTGHQEYTLDGLQEGMNYSFTVNQSGFNEGRVFSTGPVYARTFTAVPSEVPQSLEAMFTQLTEVSLSWREVLCVQQNGPITGYVVRYYATCSDRNVQQSKSVMTTGVTIDSLTPFTEYAFQVAAVNVNGTGPFSEPITLGVILGAPQLLEATFVQSTEVYFSWREVPCVQNGRYVVRYYATCGAGRNEQQSQSVVTTGSTINGLTPFIEYAFQVAAVTVNGTGPFSEPITLGGAPRLVAVTPVNSTSVVLSWSEVQCFIGSGAVTYYLVQYQSSCCGGTVQNVTTDGLVQVISGLTPNTVYTFRVAAVGAGQKIGPFSNPGNTSLPDTPHVLSEAPAQHTSAWAAVAGVALIAVLVLMAVAVVESAVIWHQQRSITRMKDQTQSVYSAVASVPSEKAKTAEIPLKECSAYGQVDQGGAEREEPHIYELP